MQRKRSQVEEARQEEVAEKWGREEARDKLSHLRRGKADATGGKVKSNRNRTGGRGERGKRVFVS
jgi:hypothetical protein